MGTRAWCCQLPELSPKIKQARLYNVGEKLRASEESDSLDWTNLVIQYLDSQCESNQQ